MIGKLKFFLNKVKYVMLDKHILFAIVAGILIYIGITLTTTLMIAMITILIPILKLLVIVGVIAYIFFRLKRIFEHSK